MALPPGPVAILIISRKSERNAVDDKIMRYCTWNNQGVETDGKANTFGNFKGSFR